MKRLWCLLLSGLLILTFAVGCEPPAEEGEGWETNVESQVLIQPEPEPEPECNEDLLAAKPVIYLYPEKKTEVLVKLDFAGDLTVTYPAYNDGWNVIASPDGSLVNLADGREYSYLFWEGVSDYEYSMEQGFVVKGADTAAFLQEKLALLGLTPREYNEFIVYWLPRMLDNPYNLITFQFEDYAENARLMIEPAPDSVLRVFMTFTALETPIEIPEQTLPTFERHGFTVVEWGGTEIK